jgi:outer membrane receptor protein involved in Fe transport
MTSNNALAILAEGTASDSAVRCGSFIPKYSSGPGPAKRQTKTGFLRRARRVAALLLLPAFLFAGTTGKIAGRITQQGKGDPLPSAIVRIVGEKSGAATDTEGRFVILNVKPGTHTLRATMVGYSEGGIQGVVVRADLTTTVDFELAEGAIQLDEVVAQAERKMINKDETSRTAIVNAQTFSDLPVVSAQEIVGLQAGFVTGSDGELHARGGRSGEVAYLIDGVPVRDPLSGGFAGQVDKYAIEELQVLTGGFNAEYGKALSGVVNIVTKEGGNTLAGRMEYTSPQLNAYPYHRADALAFDEWGKDAAGNFVTRVEGRGETLVPNVQSAYQKQTLEGTPELWPDISIPGQFSGVLNGPVPFVPDLKFFLTGRYANALDYLPWGYNKEREFNGKLTYSFGSTKLNLSMQRFYKVYKPYSHAWKYMPEGYEVRKDFSWRDNLKINHVFNPTSFIEASLSHNRRYFNRYTPGKEAVFSPTGDLLYSNYLRKNNNTPPFWTNADNGVFIKNDVRTFLLKADYSNQLGRHNLVKAGVELQNHVIDRVNFQEPYPSGFHAYENFRRKPFEYAIYAQDKLEFDAFIINAGLRFDYVDVNDTRWESVRVPAGYVDDNKKWVPQGEVSTPPKQQWSPRLGIAFPISDKTVFYSSYGHFFQIPDYVDMYTLRNPTMDAGIVGNPGILPQKTVAFEFGVKQEIGSVYSVDIGAYFKDVTNLVGSTYLTVFPYEYTVFDNSNYGGIQGFEINLTRRMSDYWFANLNYTYSVAKGNESDPREGFNDFRRASAILRPKRVFLLDFDREHVFYGTFGVEFPHAFGPSLADLYPFENTSVNIVVRASTGLPYTPLPPEESNSLLVEKNSGRMPGVQRVDVRLARTIDIGDAKLVLFCIVNNVLDQINATSVWAYTGLPLDAGPAYSRTYDRMRNPENVDLRRSIQAGVRLDF